jgi:hypothetical protein
MDADHLPKHHEIVYCDGMVDRLLDQRDTLRLSADCLPRFSIISYPGLRRRQSRHGGAEGGNAVRFPW